MLFVVLMTTKTGKSPQETIGRRVQWKYPKGIKVIAEYWLQIPSPKIIWVAEMDSAADMLAVSAEWGDLFDITVAPAITGEEGLALAKQMMQQSK